MRPQLSLLLLVIAPLFSSLFAQHYPGGVSGVEVWYKADHYDLGQGFFQDYSGNDLEIRNCSDYSEELFNFNPSLSSDQLCLSYTAPLEHSINRSFFIVSDPVDNQRSYPHIGHEFRDFVPFYDDSLSRNTFVIETKQGYASEMPGVFAQHQNAHVHFYAWNQYDQDKKFKSYGQEGETTFYVGKGVLAYDHPSSSTLLEILERGGLSLENDYFSGLVPEYLAFDRQLSENERNRLESYLALKYGITKWQTEHYQNAKNKIFWDKANNALFPNNIFGIGRDDVSGLQQLQCESAHARDFLVVAVDEIVETNEELQGLYSIENNNFMVFGDTGADTGFTDPDAQNLHRYSKVWLAQVTGEKIRWDGLHFRLELTKFFEPAPELLDQVMNEELVLWMLHDEQVNNSFVSDFDNGHVKFYKPISIDQLPNGKIYAHFREDANQEPLFFDADETFFDQFTFAVGPEVIVQFRPRYDCEAAAEGQIDCYELDIIITEGELEEEPQLYSEEEEPIEVWFNDEQTEINGELTFTAYICAPMTYMAIVNIGGGTFEYEYQAEPIGPYIIDLGPDPQYLTAQQPTLTLDAAQYLDDPQATYQWFFNDVPLSSPFTTGSLIADQPGHYCVEVTTGDRHCTYRHCVKVLTQLEADIDCYHGFCDDESNEIHITNLDGAPNFTTILRPDSGPDIVHVHSGNTVIDNFPPGDYTIIITDSLGAEYQTSCNFPSGIGAGSYTFGLQDNDAILSSGQTQIILDTAALTTGWGSYTYTYEWFYDDGIIGQVQWSDISPQITVTTPGEYTAQVYIEEFNCYVYITQTIESVLEGTISQDGDCEEHTNTFAVEIDFGFPPYTLTIYECPGGSCTNPAVYQSPITINGNYQQSDFPYGTYQVVLEDNYGNQMMESIDFVDPMEGVDVDLIGYLIDDTVIYVCNWSDPLVFSDYEYIVCDCCGTGYIDYNGNIGTILDAAQNISYPQNYAYEWFKNGVSMGIYTPQVFFGTSPPPYQGGVNEFTIKITNINNGCYIEDSFIAYGWADMIEYTPAPPTTYSTTVYPNPGGSDTTFYYDISKSSGESFSGTVELFSMTGALIYSNAIQGAAAYTLPYRLVASGAYIIRTTTDDGTVTIDRVIIK